MVNATVKWWARQDLNLRPPGYQPGAPTKLSYPPKGKRPTYLTQLIVTVYPTMPLHWPFLDLYFSAPDLPSITARRQSRIRSCYVVVFTTIQTLAGGQ